MAKIFRSILFIAFAGISHPAWGDGTWVDCSRTNSYYQYFSTTTIQIGKDAVVGDLLGGWITSSDPTAWTCAQRSSSQTISPQLAVQGYPPYPIWNTTTTEGQAYSVYNSTVKSGLGYIARWRYTVKGQTSAWYPLTVAGGIYQTPAELFPVTYDSGRSFNIGVDVQIRFVKTANTLTAGTTPVFDPMYTRHYQFYNGASSTGGGTYMIAEFLAGGLVINTTGGTCTTPNVDVTLPPAARSDFSGPGYTTSRTDFKLNFTQCPAGLASISYSFMPTTTIKNNSQGVFAPDSTSTASGVALQMLTDQDIPVTFNTDYLLTSYDSGTANTNYSVPLRAGLYQTENTVSSGNVSGSVTFTLKYK